MSRFHLKPDRAEVIVPAADIYTRVMQLAQATHMHVPKVGLSDGMVWPSTKRGRPPKGVTLPETFQQIVQA